jgi:hypothetical protein
MSGRSDEDSLLKRKVIEILKKTHASILLFFEQKSDDYDNPSWHRAFHHYLTR